MPGSHSGGRAAVINRIAIGLLLAAVPYTAFAQAWPARPVHLVLSQPPGSSPDILARLVADRLTKLVNDPKIKNWLFERNFIHAWTTGKIGRAHV